MLTKIMLCVATALCPLISSAQITGDWHGSLNLGAAKLTVVFHLSDSLTCTMDSPDQNATGIPCSIVRLTADSIEINVPIARANYSAVLSGSMLKGTFKQNGYSLPLELSPGLPERRRPQSPERPFPYATEEVFIQNHADGTILAGTLTYPMLKRKNFPIVVMTTGSGQHNRDEEIMGHRPFAVIADYLAKSGIASLRCDDRGIGGSTGPVDSMTTYVKMTDTKAVLDYARSLPNVGKTGVLGHSEGGRIAFMLGASGDADFIVTLGAPGIRGDSILLAQNLYALRLAGQSMDQNTLMQHILSSADKSPWLKYFLNDDPATDIATVKCPVMAINGSNDVQVSPDPNLTRIKRLLPERQENLTIVYPGLNHLFQHSTTGAPSEYGQIEETISPEVLADVARWINSLN